MHAEGDPPTRPDWPVVTLVSRLFGEGLLIEAASPEGFSRTLGLKVVIVPKDARAFTQHLPTGLVSASGP